MNIYTAYSVYIPEAYCAAYTVIVCHDLSIIKKVLFSITLLYSVFILPCLACTLPSLHPSTVLEMFLYYGKLYNSIFQIFPKPFQREVNVHYLYIPNSSCFLKLLCAFAYKQTQLFQVMIQILDTPEFVHIYIHKGYSSVIKHIMHGSAY